MISLLLKDIAEKKNLYIQNNASLRKSVELMNKNQKGVVVVLDGQKPAGILTERDIIVFLHNEISLSENAREYARKPLITTRGDRTIGYALNLMIENNIRRVVVVDESGNFMGVVTQKDMLRHLEDDFYLSAIKVKHIRESLKPLISVDPADFLREILDRMVKNKISAVPVVKDKKAVGIITEKDILRLAGRRVSLKSPVVKHMSKPVITAMLDTALVDVVKKMNRNNIRRVVIRNRERTALGIVTIRDVLKNLEGDYSKFLERKLKHTKDILNLLPEMLIEVADTRKEQLIIWANEKVMKRFGKRIIDKRITEFIPPNTWEKIYGALLKSGKIENIKYKKDEGIYELSGFFIRTEGRVEKGRVQLIVRDITEEIKMSVTDPLTSLYNRRFINEFLIKELERSKRLRKHFSIAIVDLDDFKKLNDTYGHLAGDIVLKAVSGLMTAGTRKVDLAGRYGGEEFVIIMPETAKNTALQAADRLRAKIENETIPISKRRKVKITASFGIATFPEDGASTDDLLITADDRLYKAKREGKNRVVCI